MANTSAKTVVTNALTVANGAGVSAMNVSSNSKKKMLKKIKLSQLEKRCRQTTEEVMRAATIYENNGRKYSFKNNGASVLAVAHCDWVKHLPVHFSSVQVPYETLVYSPQLDDRLGVYTILDLMPSLGVKMDILLTDDEEIGRSTASLFDIDKKYNWIVEFDRCGVGAVMYDYDFPCDAYFNVKHGTFSDICQLEHLGCQGINIGVAYHDEHTTRCHMVLEDYAEQMVRFQTMWTDLHKTHMPYEPVIHEYSINGWWDDDDYGVEFCDNCNQARYTYELREVDQSLVCNDCYEEMLEKELELLNAEDLWWQSVDTHSGCCTRM